MEVDSPVTPDILVHGDGDKEGAGDGLVRVDGVGADDGWDGGDLDAGGAEGDDDDCLPGPLSFHSDGCDNVADVLKSHVSWSARHFGEGAIGLP